MADDRTRKDVRDLLSGMDRHEGKVPLRELIELADSADQHITVDRTDDPPVVFVRPARSRRFTALSDREREVAELVAVGMTNRQISRKLFISEATVKDHVHAVLAKTKLPNRAAIAAAWHGGDGDPPSAD